MASIPKLLISDEKGKISFDERLGATGMKDGRVYRLEKKDFIRLPSTSRLFVLPSRTAIGLDERADKFMALDGAFAVAAFLPPGYTATYSTAYSPIGYSSGHPIGQPKQLPLFSYAAACMMNGEIYATAIHIDRDLRHDCRYIDLKGVRAGAKRFVKIFRGNRLVPHLADCALIHGCPNAQNFFLSRYEAPLPTSPSCNASCAGCISFQPEKKCPATQPRIKFIPTAREITDIALYHIAHVKDAIVSFGQGCEGEPLLQSRMIECAIRSIRKETGKGTIHMNTNGSKPDAITRLIDAGLDSVRISMNSAEERYYSRYYRPRGYSFRSVLRSIVNAKAKGAFVSINYLTMPGFTDRLDEARAFEALIRRTKIDMVQWRNMNYDPLHYFEVLKTGGEDVKLLGISKVIDSLKIKFPRIKMGYFNPHATASQRR